MLLKRSGGYEARDPSVIFHGGSFYHCFTKGAEAIYITRANTPEDLLGADERLVYTPEAGKEYSKQLWAPELHVIDGVCYIYVACDDGDNKNHRMYALTNGSSDPMKPYSLAGKISDSSDKWAIDGTVFRYRGQLYTAWSGWEGDENVCQNLYIAKMSDPLTVSSHRVMISTPEYPWEKADCDGIKFPFINEGPCAYEKDGRLALIYSASGSWANHYCMGILTLCGEDPTNPKDWKKSSLPALSAEDGWNGPGHCSVFFDGQRDYIAFHTYDEGKTRGWNNVHAVIAPFEIKDERIILQL